MSSNSHLTTDFNPKAFELRKNAVLQTISNFTLEYNKSPNQIRVLDYGCGNGLMAAALETQGYSVTGVDIDEVQIQSAKLASPKSTFITSSVYDYKDSEVFDIVLSLEVIEHLYDPETYLKLCSLKLKPNGIFCLTTPYYGYTKNLLISLLNKWDKHHMPNTKHGHIKLFSEKMLIDMLSISGFDNISNTRLGRIRSLAMMHFVRANTK